MERVAFVLKLRPGREAKYDLVHQAVWPEMLSLLKSAGIHEYSIFRRNTLLFLYLKAEKFDEAWSRIEQDPVNIRWQKAMAEYFEPVEDLLPGERLPLMREVFYLP